LFEIRGKIARKMTVLKLKAKLKKFAAKNHFEKDVEL
jgi:hypothetical protein